LNLSSPRVVDRALEGARLAELGLWLWKWRVTSVIAPPGWRTRTSRSPIGPTRRRLARPRRPWARKTLLRAYDSVFKDRGSQGLRSRGRYSRRQVLDRQESCVAISAAKPVVSGRNPRLPHSSSVEGCPRATREAPGTPQTGDCNADRACGGNRRSANAWCVRMSWSCPQLSRRERRVTPLLVRPGGTPLWRVGGAQ
jgi:hypothetical protein